MKKPLNVIIILFVLFYSMLLLFSPVVFASDIDIIKSRNIEPYNVALKGLKKVVDANMKEHILDKKLSNNIALLKHIESKNPDIILTLGAQATYIANHNILNIPIVYSMVSNPDMYNFSGKNITGIKLDIPIKNQLQIYKTIMPEKKKIGIIYNSKALENKIKILNKITKELAMQIVPIRVNKQEQIPRAIERLISIADTLWLFYDPVVTSSQMIVKEIILFNALKNRLPVVGFNKWTVTAGAFIYFHYDYSNIGTQTGKIVNRILDKVKPDEIDIETPNEIKVFFNEAVFDRLKSSTTINIPENSSIWIGD